MSKFLAPTATHLGNAFSAIRNLRPDDLRAALEAIETWKRLIGALILQIALAIGCATFLLGN